MAKKPGRIYASDLAREVGMNEKIARAKLRAAGYEAPYKEKDRAKLIAVLRNVSVLTVAWGTMKVVGV